MQKKWQIYGRGPEDRHSIIVCEVECEESELAKEVAKAITDLEYFSNKIKIDYWIDDLEYNNEYVDMNDLDGVDSFSAVPIGEKINITKNVVKEVQNLCDIFKEKQQKKQEDAEYQKFLNLKKKYEK